MILVEISLHEGNVTRMETCNKCLLDNFLHYCSICGEGFFRHKSHYLCCGDVCLMWFLNTCEEVEDAQRML